MAGPPFALIPCLVQRIVVAIAQGHGELVRHLETERPLLGEANMVRLGGPAGAHEAGLAGNEDEMRLVANALVLGNEQLTRFARALGKSVILAVILRFTCLSQRAQLLLER